MLKTLRCTQQSYQDKQGLMVSHKYVLLEFFHKILLRLKIALEHLQIVTADVRNHCRTCISSLPQEVSSALSSVVSSVVSFVLFSWLMNLTRNYVISFCTFNMFPMVSFLGMFVTVALLWCWFVSKLLINLSSLSHWFSRLHIHCTLKFVTLSYI